MTGWSEIHDAHRDRRSVVVETFTRGTSRGYIRSIDSKGFTIDRTVGFDDIDWSNVKSVHVIGEIKAA